MVEGLQGKHVRDIACGSSYSAAITSNGELYTWGQGHRGQLGHGDILNQNKPKQVGVGNSLSFNIMCDTICLLSKH